MSLLQFRAVDRRALEDIRAAGLLGLPGEGVPWESMAELEAAADEAVTALRRRRGELCVGRTETWRHALDARIQCLDGVEYFDRPEVPEATKAHMARRLHRMNRLLGSYHRFLRILRPSVEAIRQRERRSARLLELASGSGEFTLELARLAHRQGLDVEVEGSDIVGRHVELGNQLAGERGVPARFRRLNAFAFGEDVVPGDFDLIFVLQSIHHFSPGQVAMMVAQARLAGARHFVGIDGTRSLSLVGILPMLAVAVGGPDHRFVHDAWMSARKFYAESELALAARIAAPRAEIATERREPGLTVLRVRF